METNNEIWKPVVGYEGLYEVSNLGRVKSLISGKILKQYTRQNGYMSVGLHKNGKQRTSLIHILVTQAFIPNPNNLPQVNHKDENKANNNVSNLEWCDASYNINYGDRNSKCSSQYKERGWKNKPILQYSLDGEFIKEWKSAMDVKHTIGFSGSTGHISDCCKHLRKQAYGYRWEYK